MSSPPPSPSGFCHQCGRPLSPVAQFCPSCGTPRYGAGAPFVPVAGTYGPGGRPQSAENGAFGAIGILGIVIIVVVVIVGISVALSYVLYFEVSNLTKGPSSIPLGTAFDLGISQPASCTPAWEAAMVCATSGDFAYLVSVAVSTISLGSVLFSVINDSGLTFHNVGVAEISVMSNSGQALAYSVFPAGAGISMTGPWLNYANGILPSTLLSSSDLIVVDMGQTATTQGAPLALQAIGLNPYSGSVSTGLL